MDSVSFEFRAHPLAVRETDVFSVKHTRVQVLGISHDDKRLVPSATKKGIEMNRKNQDYHAAVAYLPYLRGQDLDHLNF